MDPKKRLDQSMEERGLARSRSLAQRLIMEGFVRVNGQMIIKPSIKVSNSDLIELMEKPRFVSRGGEKLIAALQYFELENLGGKICVDVGASTGGFTDCLLQHGADKVYAIDVGYGILDWKIRNDPRVVTMERTNARYVTSFEDSINFVTIDASFISLKVILPVVFTWLKSNSDVVALIKPQFEAGRRESAKGNGVIRDPEIHREILRMILNNATDIGFQVNNLIRSPLVGPKGNVEFLVHLSLPQNDFMPDLGELIDPLFHDQNKS